MDYNFIEIEKKWQQIWGEQHPYAAENKSSKPKFYVLDMFPYPSGAGLHVGHPLGYIASDIYARYKRHKGFNVLHPQGYDSFGLPAEQYAIQTGQHPALTTETNINRYREQLDRMGFSFDWSREVRTSDPKFYRWTQWIFLQLFEHYYNADLDKAMPISHLTAVFEKEGNEKIKTVADPEVSAFTAEQWNGFTATQKQEVLLHYRLTYLAETEVNWCADLGTVLANDEIVNGVSERGGYPVIKKKMKQWSMRIGAYAERLISGLETIDWPSSLKEMQRNWIGKSEGAKVFFQIADHTEKIEVFTTRPDTIFGVTFMTLAPELELVQKITTPQQQEIVMEYIKLTAQRSERERMSEVKKISGVFTGAYAVHPLTKEKIPIWIGDYVLADYGTGAVMAVPCGDQRDYLFAKHFNLPIKNIFEGISVEESAFEDKANAVLTTSDFLNGLTYAEAIPTIIEELEKQKVGQGTVTYRLRDAIFSRQRYWGEPIPIYYKEGFPQPLSEEDLPLKLPEVEKYLPTSEGAPPLGNATDWAWDCNAKKVVSKKRIDHQTVFPLELNTMPGWAGSSWYFNRYMDPHNEECFASEEALNYWQEIDLYVGGSEHATGHLLYSRFWQKFLFDVGLLSREEYAKKLINQGMILGTSAFVYRKKGTQTFLSKNAIKKEDQVEPLHVDVNFVSSSDELNIEKFKQWQPQFEKAVFVLESGKYIVGRDVEKMSKSKYNIVNPDMICDTYGADTLRMYEMFLGPIEQAKPWNTAGISGVHNFLKKYMRLFYNKDKWNVSEENPSNKALKILHETIKKVTQDIEQFSFNTCVSAFMICVNELSQMNANQREILSPLTVLLAPFAPHLAAEMWVKLGNASVLCHEPFPLHDEKYLVEDQKNYPVSFNGKMRFILPLSLSLSRDAVEKAVLNDERTSTYLNGLAPKKVIIVPNKIINIVF